MNSLQLFASLRHFPPVFGEGLEARIRSYQHLHHPHPAHQRLRPLIRVFLRAGGLLASLFPWVQSI
jgi:hypothetical protein